LDQEEDLSAAGCAKSGIRKKQQGRNLEAAALYTAKQF